MSKGLSKELFSAVLTIVFLSTDVLAETVNENRTLLLNVEECAQPCLPSPAISPASDSVRKPAQQEVPTRPEEASVPAALAPPEVLTNIKPTPAVAPVIKKKGKDCVVTEKEMKANKEISDVLHGVNLFTTWSGPMGVKLQVHSGGGATVVYPKRNMLFRGKKDESFPAKLCVDFNKKPLIPYIMINGDRVDFRDKSFSKVEAPRSVTKVDFKVEFKRSTN